MWLLVWILSIKMQMPTWYWVIYTIITIIKPLIVEPVKFQVLQEMYNKK